MANEELSAQKQLAKPNHPGLSLEYAVARIQQMMDPNSTVTQNEKLVDRVGNKREFDIVIRGFFGGRPVLGVMECKDHSRKKGPDVIEAFAKKTENLGANLRIVVSKKGFTKQALTLAKHENIGCLSLLPEAPEQVGFSVGQMWYGVIRKWTHLRLALHIPDTPVQIAEVDIQSIKFNSKPVINWFIKELLTKYGDHLVTGEQSLIVQFDAPRTVEVAGQDRTVTGITCIANRVVQNKRKWVSWSGDAFYDWQTGLITIGNNGKVVGSPVETDLSQWDNYDGGIPPACCDDGPLLRAVFYETQKWDPSKDDDVPDLGNL
jgi:hypothetical protein